MTTSFEMKSVKMDLIFVKNSLFVAITGTTVKEGEVALEVREFDIAR